MNNVMTDNYNGEVHHRDLFFFEFFSNLQLPFTEWGWCPSFGNDIFCFGLECAQRSRSDNSYVCCIDTSKCEFADCCNGAYKSGETCPSTMEADCEGSLACGKLSRSDDTYVCCADTSTCDGTDDCCNGAYEEGEECPSTNDKDCEGSFVCGKESSTNIADDTYVCCDKTSSCFGGTLECC
jgi:hypothetical protein